MKARASGFRLVKLSNYDLANRRHDDWIDAMRTSHMHAEELTVSTRMIADALARPWLAFWRS